MDFTIITPNLNYGRYLGDCLQSVVAQSGATFEHLVLDGGSTDDSAEVAARFPHATWISGPDEGMSDAINKGFDRAAGEWVMWLNADDRLKPGALAEVLRFVKSTGGTDVVFGSFDFVSESGDTLRRMRLCRWSRFVSVHHCCYVPSTACFLRRRTVIDEGARLDKEFRYVMDGELYARLDSMGKSFRYLPVSLADFRVHGGNASLRNLASKGGMREVLQAERQHVESRAIRRVYGITLFRDPYPNGLVDGILWIAARLWKGLLKLAAPSPRVPEP